MPTINSNTIAIRRRRLPIDDTLFTVNRLFEEIPLRLKNIISNFQSSNLADGLDW